MKPIKKRKNLTNKEVAAELGVSERAFYRMQAKDSRLPPGTLNRVLPPGTWINGKERRTVEDVRKWMKKQRRKKAEVKELASQGPGPPRRVGSGKVASGAVS